MRTVAPVRPRHRHSPRVRRLAADHGLEADALTGTGPSGRVTPDDVLRAAAEPAAAVEPARAPAARGGAPVTSVVEVDVTAALRTAASAEAEGDLGLLAVVTEAVAVALGSHPTLAARRDLAVVVRDLGGARTVLLRDAGDLGLAGIVRRLGTADDDTARAAFTVTGSGHRGLLWQSPALPAGQVAGLAVGAVTDRAVVVGTADGERSLGIRPVVTLVLAHDPEAVVPDEAAACLLAVRDRVLAPR